MRAGGSEKDERQGEIKQLRGALRCNGYPEWTLKELYDSEERNNGKQTSGKRKEKNREKTKKFTVVVRYIKGFSEESRGVFEQYNISTYFKTTNTISYSMVC